MHENSPHEQMLRLDRLCKSYQITIKSVWPDNNQIGPADVLAHGPDWVCVTWPDDVPPTIRWINMDHAVMLEITELP